jgi:predicted CoA-binding protein
MDHDHYSDDYIRDILTGTKTIAMVGASSNASRPSHTVFHYLRAHGYRVIPVNPGQAGATLAGEPIHARLADILEPIDMVDVFRAAEHTPAVVQEALALSPLPKVIWMQLGVRNDEAAAMAEAAGIRVVMNRCPKIEYARLLAAVS